METKLANTPKPPVTPPRRKPAQATHVIVPKPTPHVGAKTASLDVRGLFDKEDNDTEVDILPVVTIPGTVQTAPVKPLIPAYAPDPGEDLGIFPVSRVQAEQRLVSSKQPVHMAFAIIKGEAVEYLPDNDDSLRQLRVLGPGNLVNACLFETEREAKGSLVTVIAKTELIVYRITEDDLEAHDVPVERRATTRRNRERFLRTALANEANLLRSGRKQLFEDLREAQAQSVELDGILKSDLTRRCHRLKDEYIQPLQQQLAQLLKEREAEAGSLNSVLEMVRSLNAAFEEDNETLYQERDALYKTITRALMEALERGDSKLVLVDLLGQIEKLFGRKLRRPKSLL